MRELVECIIKTLVDHPKDIELTAVEGEKTSIYELRLNQEDIGKVIGKSGKTVAAIRGLLTAVAARHGRKATFEVVE
ncbi:MAG: KH domain-containing protein [Verrucomicrobiota bacterium]